MSAAKKTQRAAVEGNISVSRSWVADMELLAAQVSVAFRLPLTLDNARVVQAASELLEQACGARTALAAALHANASPELLRAALAGLEAAIAKAEGA